MRRTPRNALLISSVAFAGLVLTGVLAFLSPLGHGFDVLTHRGFTAFDRPGLTPALTAVELVGTQLVYGLLGALLVAVSLRQRRQRLAGVLVMILVGSEATTELLKPMLAGLRPSGWAAAHSALGQASWPSGHTTAAMSLCMCTVVVSPARYRQWTAAAGAALTLVVAYGMLVPAGHLSTDVIAALFVSSLWTALGLAVLWRDQQPAVKSASPRSFIGSLARSFFVYGAIAVLAAIVLAIARPQALLNDASAEAEFLAGALLIALLAQTLATGLAALLGTSRGARANVLRRPDFRVVSLTTRAGSE